jgi:hypothetical protein
LEISGRHATAMIFGAGSKAVGVLMANADLAGIRGVRA